MVVSYITSLTTSWIALVFLLTIHLSTNYLAVRAVCMQTLNRQRANLVFATVLQQLADMDYRHQTPPPRSSVTDFVLPEGISYPTPHEIQLRERIFERDGVLRWNGDVLGYCRLGVQLQAILDCLSVSSSPVTGSSSSPTGRLSELLEIFQDEQYLVWYDEPRRTFLVVLEDQSDATAQLSAWMFALSLARERSNGNWKKGEDLMAVLRRERDYVRRVRGGIFERLGERWDLENGALETTSGARIRRPKLVRGKGL